MSLLYHFQGLWCWIWEAEIRGRVLQNESYSSNLWFCTFRRENFGSKNSVSVFWSCICVQVKRTREEYGKLDRVAMSVWECIELLNEFVDESDPDLDEPQIEHLLQTAEAIRKDYPDEDWLHLTGLIHGNLLMLWMSCSILIVLLLGTCLEFTNIKSDRCLLTWIRSWKGASSS